MWYTLFDGISVEIHKKGVSPVAIGERIRFFRTLRGMTQKYLGIMVGFPEGSADVRMAQYETGSRTPKTDLIRSLAEVLDVSPSALTVPDIDSDIGLMHTLFTLEDTCGLRAGEIDGEVCLRLDRTRGREFARMIVMLSAWQQEAAKLDSGEITKEEYDRWRYYYPQFDTSQRWVKVPSQDLMDLLMDGLTDEKPKKRRGRPPKK